MADEVIVTVNESELTRAGAQSLASQLAARQGVPPQMLQAFMAQQGDQLMKQAAEQFIHQTLLQEEVQERDIPVSDEEVDAVVAQLSKSLPEGVYQGQDLYDSRVSLIQYRELFNAFPQVTFPISVLASVTNQELVSYAWIFPNVIANGHWWYSNTPAYIEHDCAARLEAVPRTKQIGYYSDMYKLEFGLPKFRMYKQVLAKVLAERFVIDRGWTEQQAIDLGVQTLRGNVERIFGPRPA